MSALGVKTPHRSLPPMATSNSATRCWLQLLGNADTTLRGSPNASEARWTLLRGTCFAPATHMYNDERNDTNAADLICFSHLRWNFVFQRPQHLMTRFARERRVWFFEEPIFAAGITPRLNINTTPYVVNLVPHLPEGLSGTNQTRALRALLDSFMKDYQVEEYIAWYYTPMALTFTEHLQPLAVVYDCMDELSAFQGAPPALKQRERQLLELASVVFTGGYSLYEAKRHRHPNIHACPSSVDADHFARARALTTEPEDQSPIPHPRLGFFGVIDERMDRELIAGVAASQPDWQLVMLGPIAKIDPAALPRAANIHYLGTKSYDELPSYLAGWDVALLPFARNDATRFISPTKTPEYLAAGKPVVSTSIRDVVRPYGQQGLARIADDVPGFVSACKEALDEAVSPRLARADAFLRLMSWDRTWNRMRRLIDSVIESRETSASEGLATAGGGI
jgi:UDP-galactopyranose mutase